MKTFDNFAPDAKEVRESVIASQFSTQQGPDGAEYTGISLHPVPHWPGLIAKHLGRPIIARLSCFRLNLQGELPHSWVHSDGLCASHASVLYLNTPEQCQGGTAFWRHKHLGIDRMPSADQLRKYEVPVENFSRNMERDWKVKELWEIEKFVTMKWNRFVTYSTSLFHSRYPFEGFGSGPQDGRLIWICFYDLADGEN